MLRSRSFNILVVHLVLVNTVQVNIHVICPCILVELCFNVTLVLQKLTLWKLQRLRTFTFWIINREVPWYPRVSAQAYWKCSWSMQWNHQRMSWFYVVQGYTLTFWFLCIFSNEAGPDFQIKVQVYSCCAEDSSIANTPRKLAKKLKTSISRATGRKISSVLQEDDPEKCSLFSSAVS